MSRRVFVVNEPMYFAEGEWRRVLNLGPARDYGELVHVLPAGVLPDDITFVVRTIRERMADFGPSDYLMLIGDPRASAVASAVAAKACNGCLRLLHWQRRQRRYDLVEISGLYDVATQAA
jgi:hypothetical protein